MKRHSLSQDSRTGKYYARIQVEGVRKKFFFGTNRRKAEQDLRELEQDVETGERSFAAIANVNVDRSNPADLTIEELVRQYLDWVKANRALGTWDTKRQMLQPFLDRYGDCQVSDINHSTLAKYYAWLKKYRGRSANGGNHHMREVKTLLRWGEDTDVCICPVRRFPMLREAPAATKKFTDEELPMLLERALPDFRDMLLFGLLTGLRPQELRGLRREHVRTINERLCVVLEYHKTSKTMHIPAPRVVPLSAQATEIVERQTAKHPKAPHIFLNDDGKPYKAGGFRQRLKRVCVRCGIEQRPPYALRHYFGTKQAGLGLNQAILAQVMGHTTPITTMRYVAKVPAYQQQAMDAMEAGLSAVLGSEGSAPKAEPEAPEIPPLSIDTDE